MDGFLCNGTVRSITGLGCRKQSPADGSVPSERHSEQLLSTRSVRRLEIQRGRVFLPQAAEGWQGIASSGAKGLPVQMCSPREGFFLSSAPAVCREKIWAQKLVHRRKSASV